MTDSGLITKERRIYRTHVGITSRLDRAFVNETPLLSVGPKAFTLTEVVAAAVLSKTNLYLIGKVGTAKTVLSETIWQSVFGGSGFYLRGDINLQLKDLFMGKINWDGKTPDEIFKVSPEYIATIFTLIDELNRVPGVLQNQFLNIADGYIEIRGKKYSIGRNGYLFMVATGNPASNGDHPGAFDEELALLNRIPLIINVDNTDLAEGDRAEISEMDIDKDDIVKDDALVEDVISSYHHLRKAMEEDEDIVGIRALFSELIGRAFQYVTIGGKSVNKAKEDGWRDALAGEHDAGLTMSYCSEIPIRTIKSSGRLAFALFKLAEIECSILRRTSGADAHVGTQEFVDVYLESLKLALNYDRHFIPEGLPAKLGKSHTQMLDTAFDDFRKTVDPDTLENAAISLNDFRNYLRQGDEARARKVMEFISKSADESPILRAAYNVMSGKLMKIEKERRRQMLSDEAGKEEE